MAPTYAVPGLLEAYLVFFCSWRNVDPLLFLRKIKCNENRKCYFSRLLPRFFLVDIYGSSETALLKIFG